MAEITKAKVFEVWTNPAELRDWADKLEKESKACLGSERLARLVLQDGMTEIHFRHDEDYMLGLQREQKEAANALPAR